MASESPKMCPNVWQKTGVSRCSRQVGTGISYLEDIHDFVGNRHDPYDRDEEPHGTSRHLEHRVGSPAGNREHKQCKDESPHARPKQQPLYVTTPILTKSINAFITRRKRLTE